ncbi:MAG TPA: hypothetical protein VFU04_08950 [Solirubrobacterales bacterium]|nr:hypothetical protein [Solirubrobacterales bacterium]
MTKRAKYDPVQVGRALLFELIGQHPRPLRTGELVGKVVADQSDGREVATARKALVELAEAALIVDRGDDSVEPTRAALHANSLFGAA